MIQQYLIGAMRKWLLECFSEESEQEQIKELSFEHLQMAINRYFDGGYQEFLKSIWLEV